MSENPYESPVIQATVVDRSADAIAERELEMERLRAKLDWAIVLGVAAIVTLAFFSFIALWAIFGEQMLTTRQ